MLGDLCVQLGLPKSMGDPVSGRIDCLIVHDGNPYGCEVNALTRFSKGFIKMFPVKLYTYLHSLFLLIFIPGIFIRAFNSSFTLQKKPVAFKSQLYFITRAKGHSSIFYVFRFIHWYYMVQCLFSENQNWTSTIRRESNEVGRYFSALIGQYALWFICVDRNTT
jgi:hypothetical protein